jgi:hypothetical protein
VIQQRGTQPGQPKAEGGGGGATVAVAAVAFHKIRTWHNRWTVLKTNAQVDAAGEEESGGVGPPENDRRPCSIHRRAANF